MAKREVIKTRMRKDWNLWFDCYQLAGQLLLIEKGDEDDVLTEGQRDRLVELLLNVLSSPHEYTSKRLRILKALALKP